MKLQARLAEAEDTIEGTDLFRLEFAPGIPENREFPGMDPNFRERDSRE